MAPSYVHGHADSVLRSHRTRTAENSAAYLLPELRPGMALLDVGSGPGTITADLGARVAPGRVTALEISEQALALTLAETARRGVPVEGVVGNVHALDLPADSFDLVLRPPGSPAGVGRYVGRPDREFGGGRSTAGQRAVRRRRAPDPGSSVARVGATLTAG